MWSCGYDNATVAAEAVAGGFAAVAPFTDYSVSDVLTYNTIAALRNNTSFFQYTSEYNPKWIYAKDKIYLSVKKLSEIRAQNPSRTLGMWIDAEHQDGRTSSQQMTHMQDLAEICANAPSGAFDFVIYTNPLKAPTQVYTGFNDSTTMQTLIADPNVTYISIVISPNFVAPTITEELDEQIALFGSALDMSKIMLVVGLGAPGTEFSVAQQNELRAWIVANQPGQINFWRFYATQGGARSRTPNQVIARLLGLSLT